MVLSVLSLHLAGKQFITTIVNGVQKEFLSRCFILTWPCKKTNWTPRPRSSTEGKLNLDGTHSLVKKSAESVVYQHRKRGRTSNILIMTDGKGIPIASGGIISGNHNDLYQIVPQYAKMIKQINLCGICVENSIQNADKGFDCKALRKCINRRKMFVNIKENPRRRKTKKRGRKRYFNE